MRLAMIRLYAGKCGEVGFYNVQEIGLAKALEDKCEYIYIFLSTTDKSLHMSKQQVSSKIEIVLLYSFAIGTHGFLPLSELQKFDFNCIHLMSDIQLFTIPMIAWAAKKKIGLCPYIGVVKSDIDTLHNKIASRLIFLVNSFFLKRYNCIAKTPSVMKELLSMKFPKVTYVPVGLDTLCYEDTHTCKTKARVELHIEKSCLVLLFVGRFTEQKQPLFFCQLIKSLSEYRKCLGIMIGDGELSEHVDEYIQQENLEKLIIRIPRIKNAQIWRYYVAADVFLNLSRVEIFGMCLLEAMFFGCPVIAHSAPGPNALVEHDDSGFLVDSYELSEWIMLIEKAIDPNNISVSVNAKKRVENEFLWDKLADKYLDAYYSNMEK